VNDQSTMWLMRGFYEKLNAAGKAAALATAQRALVARGDRYSHPYFWGAFVLVGERK
jgi:CHAT domain-containing protein